MRPRSKPKRSDLEDGRPLDRAAPRHRAEPGKELRKRKGLDEIVVAASVEPADTVVERIAGREEEDRRPDLGVPERATDREPVEIGKHDVEHDGVVRTRARHPAARPRRKPLRPQSALPLAVPDGAARRALARLRRSAAASLAIVASIAVRSPVIGLIVLSSRIRCHCVSMVDLDTANPLARAPLRVRLGARTGGTAGNRRLTGSTAAVLLALLAAEGVTIFAIRPLLSVHVFVGMLLIPPILLKLGSTGYRFVRYYTGSRPYRIEGPPHPALRLLAPAVVLSTVALFATGVALVTLRPRSGSLVGLHKASFVVWLIAMAAHVLAHALRVPGLTSADWRRGNNVPGSSLRRWLLAGSLVAGVILAVATVHLAGAWVSASHDFQ